MPSMRPKYDPPDGALHFYEGRALLCVNRRKSQDFILFQINDSGSLDLDQFNGTSESVRAKEWIRVGGTHLLLIVEGRGE